MFQFIRTGDSERDERIREVRAEVGAPVASAEAKAEAKSGDFSRRVNVGQLDRAGATASFLCAIHCALMPLVISLLPLMGLSFLASEPVEWALLAASATLGSFSLCLGFRRHRSRRVFAVLALALALLLAGRLFHEHHFGLWGPVFMVLGGFTMVGAHLLNHRLCHACQSCSSHDCCE